MKPQKFDILLLKNHILLILFCSLLIGLSFVYFDVSHTMENEKSSMNDALDQARINVNNHIEMVEDYLSLTHANAVVQEYIARPDHVTSAITTRSAAINNTLFAIDPFKKSLDSMQVFVFDSEQGYPQYSAQTRYSNAVFSTANISNTLWYAKTLANQGRTYWFIDMELEAEPTICAARILYDTSNPSKQLGIVKANISFEKFCYHLSRLSFGNRGDTYLKTADQLLQTKSELLVTDYLTTPAATASNSNRFLTLELPLNIKDWQITGVIPYQELYKSTYQNLMLILLALITTMIISIFISLGISRKIASPIKDLCQYMLEMQPPGETQLGNCIEINQLYDSYKSMLIEMEQLIKTREETALKLKQAELSALQSQINPHFIYNTLESVNALVATESRQEASSMITGLSNFLRSSLNNGNNLIPLKKEINQAISYFQIQQFRYSSRIKLILDLPEVIPECTVIKLILQPFIENCIIHGFRDIDYIGEITLSLKEDDTYLTISVADNGLGSDIEMLNYLLHQRTLYREDNVNFYCIQNVYQRLQNCYGDNAVLRYEENEAGGVTVLILFKKDALYQTRRN